MKVHMPVNKETITLVIFKTVICDLSYLEFEFSYTSFAFLLHWIGTKTYHDVIFNNKNYSLFLVFKGNSNKNSWKICMTRNPLL